MSFLKTVLKKGGWGYEHFARIDFECIGLGHDYLCWIFAQGSTAHRSFLSHGHQDFLRIFWNNVLDLWNSNILLQGMSPNVKGCSTWVNRRAAFFYFLISRAWHLKLAQEQVCLPRRQAGNLLRIFHNQSEILACKLCGSSFPVNFVLGRQAWTSNPASSCIP